MKTNTITRDPAPLVIQSRGALMAAGAVVAQCTPQNFCGHQKLRGRGGSVVRLLASHQGEHGSIPGGVAEDVHMWESCRKMPLGGRLSQGSPVSPPLHSGAVPYSSSFTHVGSQDLDATRSSFVGGLTLRITELHCSQRNPGGTERGEGVGGRGKEGVGFDHSHTWEKQSKELGGSSPKASDNNVGSLRIDQHSCSHGRTPARVPSTGNVFGAEINAHMIVCSSVQSLLGFEIRSRIEFRTTMEQPGISDVGVVLNHPVRGAVVEYAEAVVRGCLHPGRHFTKY
ncbi:hypothetical protein PR048_029034 [Dryococelus australis]|uniref:Uncharacterized protein n=1 Tax=Dryococelus australis TaxID=614101 RepID=A0ABQ9GC97_9NEOP|nr:hypothetical protein PR048_029034 [Dryococelus australis]